MAFKASVVVAATVLLPCSTLTLSESSANAQSVFVRSGNILIRTRAGQTRQITSSGKDSAPVLSPNRNRVAFVRAAQNKKVETPLGEEEAGEIWVVDSDGQQPKLLVSGKGDPEPSRILAAFDSLGFSPDGQRVYFLSSGWVTSRAIHFVRISSQKEEYVAPGNTLDVIQKGKYRGYLIAQMHKYHSGVRGGGYDDYWLLTPKGKELRRIGGERSYRKFLRLQTQ